MLHRAQAPQWFDLLLFCCRTKTQQTEWVEYEPASFASISLGDGTRHIAVSLACAQETEQLLQDINNRLSSETTEQRTRTACLLLAAGFVDTVKKMWQEYLSQTEQDKSLPSHMLTSLDVNAHLFIVCVLCYMLCVIICTGQSTEWISRRSSILKIPIRACFCKVIEALTPSPPGTLKRTF